MTTPGSAGAVRRAEERDVPGIIDLLARAFFDDPQFVWLVPSDASRPARLARFFGTLLRIDAAGVAEVDVVDAGGGVVGAAVWFPPGAWPPPPSRQLRALPGYLRSFGRRSMTAGRLVGVAAKVHPTERYRYLAAIGVEPAAQGRGVGGALLRAGLHACDAEATVAFLESSKLANVSLYEHFGFVALDPLDLGPGAPVVTPMIRRPDTARSNDEPTDRPNDKPTARLGR